MHDPFTPAPALTSSAYARLVAVAVRMFDNVLDATVWPLPRQAARGEAKRRIGLGFTGLGDALIDAQPALRLRGGRARPRQRSRALSVIAAYQASVEFAKRERRISALRRRPLPGRAGFASRLPSHLQSAIRVHGVRNSHLLSIAPTGTISLAFADNATQWHRTRHSRGATPARKRMPDDTMKEYWSKITRFGCGSTARNRRRRDDDRVQRRECAADRAASVVGTSTASVTRCSLSHFVTALDMSALDHMRMSAAVQPWVDSAISKT